MYQSNTIRQCLWLITTIRQNDRLTLKALQEKWTADKMGDTLYRSTFNRYRDKIYELFGLMMECDEKYQYYFSNPGELADHSIESWLLSTMTVNVALADNGFREYYKPADALFDACAAGRVLILSPWPYDAGKRHISRADCVMLNGMAEEICKAMDETINTDVSE